MFGTITSVVTAAALFLSSMGSQIDPGAATGVTTSHPLMSPLTSGTVAEFLPPVGMQCDFNFNENPRNSRAVITNKKEQTLLHQALVTDDPDKLDEIKSALEKEGLTLRVNKIHNNRARSYLRRIKSEVDKGKIKPIIGICSPESDTDDTAPSSRSGRAIGFNEYDDWNCQDCKFRYQRYRYRKPATRKPATRRLTTQRPAARKPVTEPVSNSKGCQVKSNLLDVRKLFGTVIAPEKMNIKKAVGPCTLGNIITSGDIHAFASYLTGQPVACVPVSYDKLSILYFKGKKVIKDDIYMSVKKAECRQVGR